MSAQVDLRWWQALNPAIYLVSVLPGVSVWQLNHPTDKSAYALLGATLAVVLLQHAINLLNDVSDWRLGADKEKLDSWVRFHDGKTQIVAPRCRPAPRADRRRVGHHGCCLGARAVRGGWLSFFAGGLLGFSLLILTDKLWIMLIALPMVGLGFLYNSGRRPLSYTRLGEWVTGLCYGPGVVGCLWLLIGQPIDSTALLAMTAFAALAVALLLSHQPPQIASDRAAGKHSFAVRFGERRTLIVSRSLFGVFLITSGIALYISHPMLSTAIVFCVVAAWGVFEVIKPGLGPKRILISASVLVAAMFTVT